MSCYARAKAPVLCLSSLLLQVHSNINTFTWRFWYGYSE